MAAKRRKISVLGVEVNDISEKNAIRAIVEMAKSKRHGNYVVTTNAEFVMLARRNRQFLDILNAANLAVADGQWVVWAKLIFGGKEHDRVTGVEMVEKLCEICAKKAIAVGFLGGFGDVAEIVAKRQKAKNPGLTVVIAEPGDPAMGYDLRLKRRLEVLGGAGILFVAYGMGQQEFWIDRVKNRHSLLSSNSLPVGVFIGVGGAFDYLSSVKKRAPKLMQNVGFEWLWRLVMEPARVWRMRVLPIFAVLVVWYWCWGNLKKLVK